VNKKFVIILVSVLVAGLGLYAYLGGFNTPEIKVTTSKTQYIAGKYFAGPVEDEQLGMLFREAAETLEKRELEGVLANIYYNSPEKQTDSIKAFIGIMTVNDSVVLPAGYRLQRLEGGRKVVQASVNAHYLLSPKKLYPALFDYLKKENIKTKQTYLEFFPDHHKAFVQTEITP
jgi:hypothetical protein